MRKIAVGDIVDVYYAEGHKLDPSFDLMGVKVLSTPQDTGDMWYLEDDERIYAVNPQASLLIAIVKEKGKT